MHVELGGYLFVDLLEELLELDRAVAGVQRADHLAGGDIQRCEEAAGAVAFVVVGGARRRAGQDRQDRSAAIERLDLALLVHAQHQRPFRRVEVEPDHVAHLLHKQRVLGELEALNPVRLQPERPPDPRDRRLRQPHLPGHLARRPVRAAIRRRALQRLHDHLLHPLVADRPRTARPGLIQKPLQTAADKAPTPLADRRRRDPQPPRHLQIRRAARAPKHDPRPRRQRLRRLRAPRPPLKLLPLTISQLQHRLARTTSSCCHTHRLPQTHYELKTHNTSRRTSVATVRRL